MELMDENKMSDTNKNGIEVDRASRSIPYSMKDEHYHPHTELYYLVEGETKFFIAGEVYNMKAGDLAIIPKGVLHRTINESGHRCVRINIYFKEAEISDLRLIDGMAPRLIRSQFLPEDIKKLIYKIEYEFDGERDFSRIIVRAYLDQMLVLLYRLGSTPTPESGVTPADRPIIDAARYINEHYGEELTLEGLAKRFAMSPGHFSKKFKSVTGFGLCKYITQVRILNAEKLLCQTRCSVTDISMRCGFSDSNYFAAVFKAKNKIPPYKYAKIHRGE